MASDYLMAIDAGTGSVRALIFDIDGKQIACEQREWKHREDPRYPSSMDFDWESNWALTCVCIKGALAKSSVDPKNIAGVSTTSMREGIVLYDSAGKELWACANVDARAGEEVHALKHLDPNLERELYLKSGQTFSLSALPRLLWVKNKLPNLYSKIAKIGMFNDWLIYKLSGVLLSEPSNGSTSGLLDLKLRNWDKDIARRCGIRDDIFPQVQECGSVAGQVSKKAAQESSLTQGTQLVVGGGDCQLGTVGVGVVSPAAAVIFGGSFWQYEYNSESFQPPEQSSIRINAHAIASFFQYEAIAFKSGLVMRWFRDAFCAEEKRIAAETSRDAYAILDEAAALVPPGCYGMVACSSDVMNYINWKHAAPAFINFDLDPEKYHKATFYRAIMENTALVTLGHLRLVEKATGKLPKHIVFAGGSSKSRLWAQILADVLGVSVSVPVVKEATALGAAIMAGKGIGLYSSVPAAARKLAKTEETFTPNQKHKNIYEEAFTRWQSVYAPLLRLSDEKVTNYMWTAPGL
jgi:autoinducer 2 (AI-2) kinase